MANVYKGLLGKWYDIDGDYMTLELDRAAFEELRALLRRDWAVRVLDAAGAAWKNNVPAPIPVYNEPRWVVVLPMHLGAKYGPTPDAARHAAALAVFPTLPDAVRAELGECP